MWAPVYVKSSWDCSSGERLQLWLSLANTAVFSFLASVHDLPKGFPSVTTGVTSCKYLLSLRPTFSITYLLPPKRCLKKNMSNPAFLKLMSSFLFFQPNLFQFLRKWPCQWLPLLSTQMSTTWTTATQNTHTNTNLWVMLDSSPCWYY